MAPSGLTMAGDQAVGIESNFDSNWQFLKKNPIAGEIFAVEGLLPGRHPLHGAAGDERCATSWSGNQCGQEI